MTTRRSVNSGYQVAMRPRQGELGKPMPKWEPVGRRYQSLDAAMTLAELTRRHYPQHEMAVLSE